MKKYLTVRGARVHNLRDVSVTIPRNQFTVITGLSGSGKSSLAFDTIYAEGQRRYVESLSAYARQFLGQMEKPDIDSIDGLSPAISIDQKTTGHNPRSTVGTVTEIYDYLRLLYARVGQPHCPKCGKKISKQTIDQMADTILAYPVGSRILILAPKVTNQKGDHKKVLEDAVRSGYVRIRLDGEVTDATEIVPDKNKRHTIELVIDRLVVRDGILSRLVDSLETAVSQGNGLLIVHNLTTGAEESLSQNYKCEDCGISMEVPEPKLFSFNNPYGACPECGGLGCTKRIDPEMVVPNRSKSIAEGALDISGWCYADEGRISRMVFDGLSKAYQIPLDKPVSELTEEQLSLFLYGTGENSFEVYDSFHKKYSKWAFEGIIPNLERRYQQTSSDASREMLESLMTEEPCKSCHGTRLKKEALAIRIGNRNIAQVTAMDVKEELAFFKSLCFTSRQAIIADRLLKEITSRLSFLQDVGLDYLSLNREAGTLSGGESQRIRLTTQIGSALMGVMYIMDEPSIGLHQRDNDKLLATLKHLRDIGNTVIVVEHDEETMRAADYLVDVGPGAGVHGGKIVAAGTPEEVANTPDSLTGQYLSGEKRISVPSKRRSGSGQLLKIYGAEEHNLKNVDVSFPLGELIVVTGVSGSGKSSLINGTLYNVLAEKLNRSTTHTVKYKRIEGLEHLDKVIIINQSPIGRTPRSNPATYTGLFTEIRDIFAVTPSARAKGYQKGRFSFNVKGGRCEACEGAGVKKIEMNFLADVYVPCEVCRGKRYNRETLEVTYKGKSISDILDMTAEDALDFFDRLPRIHKKLQTLCDVGLGYMKLGQSSTTVSGGEGQRIKLSCELARPATGRTVYILDEPTTGLHSDDVKRLIDVFNRLVDGGNTVIVIEHNMDVIKVADHIIDLGPEGGSRGGYIVAQGTPEEITEVKESYTGHYLKKYLQNI